MTVPDRSRWGFPHLGRGESSLSPARRPPYAEGVPSPAEPRRRWPPRPSRPWAALPYVLLETLAGWVTVTVFATIVFIPAWLVLWPRIEPRLAPLAGHPVPRVHRRSRFELRWRDWALVLLTPVAGFAGVVVLGLGVVVPVLLVLSPIGVAVTGGPVTVLFVAIDTVGSQIAAVVAGGSLLAIGVWLVPVLAHEWGRLMVSLLSDEERRLAEQIAALSEGTVRTLDQLALERRQLERDLHDGAQMHLAAAGTHLGLLQLDVEDLPGTETRAAILSSIEAVRDQLGAASSAMRTSVRGLVPAALHQGGLCAALAETAKGLPLPTRLRCDAPRLDAATETGLFLIATEALANVVRHADADHVDIRLAASPTEIVLDVTDDGRGGAAPTGTGLLSIQARARLLGGRAVIDSPPGAGTTIAVRVPRPGTPASWEAP